MGIHTSLLLLWWYLQRDWRMDWSQPWVAIWAQKGEEETKGKSRNWIGGSWRQNRNIGGLWLSLWPLLVVKQSDASDFRERMALLLNTVTVGIYIYIYIWLENKESLQGLLTIHPSFHHADRASLGLESTVSSSVFAMPDVAPPYWWIYCACCMTQKHAIYPCV